MKLVYIQKIIIYSLLIGFAVTSLFPIGTEEKKPVLNIYSARNYASDKKIIRQFEIENNVQVNLITGKARELLTRLTAEQESSVADVLIVTDAAALSQAQRDGLLQPIAIKIGHFIPSYMKAQDNSWIAVTKRARVFFYDPNKNNPTDFPTYESLGDASSPLRVAVRSSANAYNVSLIASRLVLNKEEKTTAWIQGLVSNFARDPQGNDRDQMKLVAAGGADLAIGNTYYLGLLIHSEDPAEQTVGKSLRIHFPNQETTGTHINISGVGLTRYAPNKELAEHFIKYLLSEKSQMIYANENYEYPVNPDVEPHPTVASWGSFAESDLDLYQFGLYAQDAITISEENGWY